MRFRPLSFISRLSLAIVACLCSWSAPAAQTAARALPFSDATWTLNGAATTRATIDGRDALTFETGTAERSDIAMQDGRIDVDVKLTDRRSFVYLHFRMVTPDEHEEFYLRPHKSNLPDAVQYAPVWQGESAWQLHHGPGGTAAVGFDAGTWTHVRVVMEGAYAALFVGDMSTPVLISALSRPPVAGGIGIGAFLPANVPGSGPIAVFANVTVQPGTGYFDFTKAVAAQTPPATDKSLIVSEWSVSTAAPTTSITVDPDTALPSLPRALSNFTVVPAAAGGLVELHRYVTLPGVPQATVVARVTVTAERAGLYAMDLGFSDIATVFVNGAPIFTRDDSYSFDRPRREGVIGFDQARAYLPLRAGANDVAVLLSDRFGGMGIMARFPAPNGLRVSTR